MRKVLLAVAVLGLAPAQGLAQRLDFDVQIGSSIPLTNLTENERYRCQSRFSSEITRAIQGSANFTAWWTRGFATRASLTLSAPDLATHLSYVESPTDPTCPSPFGGYGEKADFNSTRASVAGVARILTREPLDVNLSVGLARTRFGNPETAINETAWGPILGADASYRVAREVWLVLGANYALFRLDAARSIQQELSFGAGFRFRLNPQDEKPGN